MRRLGIGVNSPWQKSFGSEAVLSHRLFVGQTRRISGFASVSPPRSVTKCRASERKALSPRTVRGRRSSVRRGTAIVEMAIVLPLLILLLLGIIEFGYMMYVQHNLVNAAAQGARTGILPGATVSLMIERTRETLDESGFSGLDVEIDASMAEAPDTAVNATVKVPYANASIFGGFLPESFTLGSSCTMYR
jgi:TadE-like protein